MNCSNTTENEETYSLNMNLAFYRYLSHSLKCLFVCYHTQFLCGYFRVYRDYQDGHTHGESRYTKLRYQTPLQSDRKSRSGTLIRCFSQYKRKWIYQYYNLSGYRYSEWNSCRWNKYQYSNCSIFQFQCLCMFRIDSTRKSSSLLFFLWKHLCNRKLSLIDHMTFTSKRYWITYWYIC